MLPSLSLLGCCLLPSSSGADQMEAALSDADLTITTAGTEAGETHGRYPEVEQSVCRP